MAIGDRERLAEAVADIFREGVTWPSSAPRWPASGSSVGISAALKSHADKAVQGTVARSGEVLMLAFDPGEGSPAR